MPNWFGRKKDDSAPSGSSMSNRHGGGRNAAARNTAANTVVTLRENISSQEKRQQHLEKKIGQLIVEAKTKMSKKDKKGALNALKRKKTYEAEIDKIQNIQMTLETQVMNLESAAQNAETFKAMNAGKNAMAGIRHGASIDKVDDLMDGIKDEMDAAEEISGALAQPLEPFGADEDALLAELQELEAEAAPAQGTPLPKVPSRPLPKILHATKAEAEELHQLEAELAGM